MATPDDPPEADKVRWRKTGKTQVKTITRSMATALRNLTAVPGDRPLSDRRLAEHRDSARRGALRNVEWARAYCKEDGNTYRVNGKHTSVLLADWDVHLYGPYPSVEAVTTDYECDTLADVAALYATFDSRAVARTAGDTYRPYANTVKGLEGDHFMAIRALVGGLSYRPTTTLSDRQKSHIARVEELRTEQEFCAWVLDNLIGAQAPGVANERDVRKRRLTRSNMVQAMLRTYRIDQAQALTFWTIVRDDEVGTGTLGQDRSHPARQLGKILETVVLRGGAQSDAERREVYGKAVHAWNLYRAGKKVSELRYNSKLVTQPDFV